MKVLFILDLRSEKGIKIRSWQSGEIPWGYDCGDDRGWIMVMILVLREHLFTKANANPIQVASQNSYWRIKAQNMKVFGYRLTDLPKQPGRLAILIPLFRGGGGTTEKRGGGILMSEHQAGYWRSTVSNHSIYQSAFPNKFYRLDVMNNPRKSISGETLVKNDYGSKIIPGNTTNLPVL